jgi:hypothetical protein
VREAGGYIGVASAKARHTSELHMTARVARAEAPQATRRQAASYSRDKRVVNGFEAMLVLHRHFVPDD